MVIKFIDYKLFGATVTYIMRWFRTQPKQNHTPRSGEADDPEQEIEEDPTIEVLHGNPRETDKLIRECKFKNPLTPFINGFSKVMDIEVMRKLVLLQIAILLPGIPLWHLTFLAVAHLETSRNAKKRSAIHTNIFNTHLPTGKRLQPYWYRSDWKTVEAGQELFNLINDLPSPKHIERVFGVCIHTKKCGSAQQEFATDIKKHLIDLYDNGSLRSIDDVKSAIEEPFSCEILHNGRSRKGGGYIKVICPNISKKPFRLYGRFFDPEFLENHGATDMRSEKLSDADRNALIEHYRKILTEGIIRKYNSYASKYNLGPLSVWVVRQAPKEFQNYLTVEFLDRCFEEVRQMESPTNPEPVLAQVPKRPTGRKDSAFSLSALIELFKQPLRKQKGGKENERKLSDDFKAAIAGYLERTKDILATIKKSLVQTRKALDPMRRTPEQARKAPGSARVNSQRASPPQDTRSQKKGAVEARGPDR